MSIYTRSIFLRRIISSFFRYLASFPQHSTKLSKITTKIHLRNKRKNNFPPQPPQKMSEQLRYPLAYAFRPAEVYDVVYNYVFESWTSRTLVARAALYYLTAKARTLLEEQKGKGILYIHIHHTYDREGNHHEFRRTDYLTALAKWVMHLATSDIEETREHYRVLDEAVNNWEPLMYPNRPHAPVQCTLSYDCFWGISPPEWCPYWARPPAIVFGAIARQSGCIYRFFFGKSLSYASLKRGMGMDLGILKCAFCISMFLSDAVGEYESLKIWLLNVRCVGGSAWRMWVLRNLFNKLPLF